MPKVNPTAPSLPSLLRTVRRRKRTLVLCVSLGLGIALAYILFTPRSFRSEGKVLVRLGRENVALDATATLGRDAVVAVPPTRDDEMNSIVEIARGRNVAERVVDKLTPTVVLADGRDTGGLVTSNGITGWCDQARHQVVSGVGGAAVWLGLASKPDPSDERDQALRLVMGRLKASAVRRSNVITVRYDSGSPEFAQTVVAAAIEAFRAEHAWANRPQGSREFFARQAESERKELDRLQDSLRGLKNETGLASPQEQRRLMVVRVSSLEEEALKAETQLAIAQAKVDALSEKLGALEPTQISSETEGIGDSGTDAIRAQLYSLEVQEEEAASKYTDEHPRMQEIRRKIREARGLLSKERPTRLQRVTSPDPTYQAARSALLAEEPVLASSKAHAAKVRAQLADAKRDLNLLNDREVQIADLQRQVDMQETNYRRYASNLQDARMDEALSGQRLSNISVFQPATLDAKAVAPRRSLALALGLIVGLCGGVALALVQERIDRSIRTPDDIERHLALPAMVAIPRFSRDQLEIDTRN